MSEGANLVGEVIDEAQALAELGDTKLKDALSRLSPFELYDVVHGIANVVRAEVSR